MDDCYCIFWKGILEDVGHVHVFEHAANFFASEDTKKTQKGAGVISKPEITYLDKIEDFKV